VVRLRVLVTCVVLAFAAAPAPAVAACVDAIACVAEARAAASAAPQPGMRDGRAAAGTGVSGSPARDECAIVWRAARRPTRARAVVALRRIYLRHAALLR
jgi:hypothetical protein